MDKKKNVKSVGRTPVTGQPVEVPGEPPDEPEIQIVEFPPSSEQPDDRNDKPSGGTDTSSVERTPVVGQTADVTRKPKKSSK